jgi:hypothetical protein
MVQGRRTVPLFPHQDIPVELGERMTFDQLGLCYEAATVERLLRIELYSEQPATLRKCQRPGCQNPYFLSNRPLRKYCSDLCANDAQCEAKRKWWSEKGAEQRRTKARTTKSRRTSSRT